jgi:hypothetical protein
MSSFNSVSSFFRRTVPWTCRACLRQQAVPQQRSGYATKATTIPVPKSKRRRRIILVSGGLGLTAVAVTVNDDAKHAITAVQRSSRVVSTLFICIKEYAPVWYTPRNLPLIMSVQLSHNPRSRPGRGLFRFTQSLPPAVRETDPQYAREEWIDLY